MVRTQGWAALDGIGLLSGIFVPILFPKLRRLQTTSTPHLFLSLFVLADWRTGDPAVSARACVPSAGPIRGEAGEGDRLRSGLSLVSQPARGRHLGRCRLSQGVCVVCNLCVLRCSYSSAIVAYVDCFMREAHVVKGWFWESSSQQLLPCGGDAHMHTSTSNYKYDVPLHEAVVGANAQAHACAQKRAQMYWTPLNTKC